MNGLPGILAEIAEVAGDDAALAVARVRGGTQIYIPPKPANDHWLCELIGLDQAYAVCEKLTAGVGSRRADVPLAIYSAYRAESKNRYRVMDQMIRDQKSEREITLETGYSSRAIRRRRAKLGQPADARQISFL
jgi:hypothetical protein